VRRLGHAGNLSQLTEQLPCALRLSLNEQAQNSGLLAVRLLHVSART
jgi:hypothetical protein